MKTNTVVCWLAFASLCVCVPAYLAQVGGYPSVPASGGANGGIGCGACTIIVGMIEQIADVNNVSVVDFVSRELCQMFTGQFNMLCGFLVTIWGPAVVEKLVNDETPDVVCYSLGICNPDPGHHYCHLFPLPEGGLVRAIQDSRNDARITPTFQWPLMESVRNICNLPGFSPICNALTTTISNHLPSIDLDRDKFSVVQSFRGAFWRGKDCDDVNEFVYPGRRPLFNDFVFDSNCNGIKGANPVTGLPYEKELCDGTDQFGLIYVGDSVGAHFHVPEQWLTASKITRNIFQNMSKVMANQFDWPHVGFSTGYTSVQWPVMQGASQSSLYQRLRERNLCNHRDYQNICFNGAETSTMIPFLSSISRDKRRDKPAVVFYALMGNDVCRRHMDSPEDLTTPEQYRASVMETMQYLDNILANGSTIFLIGLVDGGFIYPTMANRLHPIGQLRGDVTYDNVYEWWNCMKIGPCFGWMNNNETYRKATSARAIELTNVLKDIAKNVKLSSATLNFLPNPLHEVLNRWEELGHQKWESLEPIDSMHPVQAMQPLIGDVLWEGIMRDYPDVLGQINPKNNLIRQLFGNQAGH